MRREVNFGDVVFKSLTSTFATLVVALLLVVGVALVSGSRESIVDSGLRFLTSDTWSPSKESYGALPFVFGTLVTSTIALLIAVPVALGIAIFLAELSPRRLRSPLSFAVELLAAVPSVIYGLWGLEVLRPLLLDVQDPLQKTLGFVPLFQKGPPSGNHVLLASLVLSLMILPTISSVTREVLRAVRDSQREGALALGATRWEMVRSVVLPHARSGIVGAVLLGLGRALGETMAMTMLIGNAPQIKASLFEPAQTLAAQIVLKYPDASGLARSALTELGLVLFVVTLVLNLGARLLVWRAGGNLKQRAA